MYTRLFTLAALSVAIQAGLVVDEAPQKPQPYVIPNMKGKATNFGGLITRTLVSSESSAGTMSIMGLSGQSVPNLAAIHSHEQPETFYLLKGQLQLFHNGNTGRVLTANDFAFLAPGSNHTYRIQDADLQLSLCMSPSRIDKFFENVGAPYDAKTGSPFDPESTAQLDVKKALSEGPKYKVHFAPPNNPVNLDLTNGTTEDGLDTWHRADQTLPDNSKEAYFISSNRGPKFLQRDLGQVVAQLATGKQTDNQMSAGTIAIKPSKAGDEKKYDVDQAFQVTEGQLKLKIGDETASLIYGDLAFIPKATSFQYWSEVGFTKFIAWSASGEGLMTDLVKGGESWKYGVWPAK